MKFHMRVRRDGGEFTPGAFRAFSAKTPTTGARLTRRRQRESMNYEKNAVPLHFAQGWNADNRMEAEEQEFGVKGDDLAARERKEHKENNGLIDWIYGIYRMGAIDGGKRRAAGRRDASGDGAHGATRTTFTCVTARSGCFREGFGEGDEKAAEHRRNPRRSAMDYRGLRTVGGGESESAAGRLAIMSIGSGI